jgi:AhpD family alkylhydroperoxidase
MDEKLKEMIAVGASVTANCIPCIRYHFTKAREVGLTVTEIKAAVQIGKAVRKGTAQKWDEEVSVLLSSSPEEHKATCGCA